MRWEEVRIEVPIGDTGRVIVNRGTKGGVVLESKPGRRVVRAKFSKRESILDEMNTQVVTTLKGNSATIYICQQVPLRQRKISRRKTQFLKFNPPILKMCGLGSKSYLNFEKIKLFWKFHHSNLE
jgi:hypothetical protein